MDVWELIVSKSTAPAGSDVWEHLVSPSPGGGGPGPSEIVHVFPIPEFDNEPYELIVEFSAEEFEIINYEAESIVEVLPTEEEILFEEGNPIIYVDP